MAFLRGLPPLNRRFRFWSRENLFFRVDISDKTEIVVERLADLLIRKSGRLNGMKYKCHSQRSRDQV